MGEYLDALDIASPDENFELDCLYKYGAHESDGGIVENIFLRSFDRFLVPECRLLIVEEFGFGKRRKWALYQGWYGGITKVERRHRLSKLDADVWTSNVPKLDCISFLKVTGWEKEHVLTESTFREIGVLLRV